MAKSDVLRAWEVRDAYRLIGECRDLGSAAELWQTRMFEGVWRLIGASGVNGGEGVIVQSEVLPVSAIPVGFDDAQRRSLTAYVRDRIVPVDPLVQGLLKKPGRLATDTRRGIIPDALYERSRAYTDYLGPARVEHRLMSFYQTISGRALSVIHVHRERSERTFSPRERRLLEFFHGEIGPLIGRALVSATEAKPETLAPRLRQTLACLIEGDSEKQVAARLGLSHATTHQYVTALYRHFGVASRAQLMAYLLKRLSRGTGAWPRSTDSLTDQL